MRQIEDMDYVPTVGDKITLKYGGGTGINTVTGEVKKVYSDKNKVYTGSVWRYDFKTDVDDSLWFMKSTQKETVDLYRVLPDKTHRMTIVPGDVKVEGLH